jgi:hypothetical protein
MGNESVALREFTALADRLNRVARQPQADHAA